MKSSASATEPDKWPGPRAECPHGCVGGVLVNRKPPEHCPQCAPAGCKCSHPRVAHLDGANQCTAGFCACVAYRPGRAEPLLSAAMKDEERLNHALSFDLERKPKKAGKSKRGYHQCRLCEKEISPGEFFTIPSGKGASASSSRRAHLECVSGTIERLQPVVEVLKAGGS